MYNYELLSNNITVVFLLCIHYYLITHTPTHTHIHTHPHTHTHTHTHTHVAVIYYCHRFILYFYYIKTYLTYRKCTMISVGYTI